MGTFVRTQLRPALVLLAVLTLVTGFAYPAAVTAVAQVAFPAQANGSFIVADGRAVGSALIGQYFNAPQYFWGRPSAAGISAANPNGYDAMDSGGSNLGPTSKVLIDEVTQRVDALRKTNGDAPIPVDLVTASASGLDPDISPAAAAYQVPRVAKARGMTDAQVQAIVGRYTQGPMLGFLGAATVNVLEVNLALDGLLR
ncbi:MAG: potassium-transporting ATPase subunit KdpC [Candidatus Limnocylindrales bacterium]